MKSSYCSGSVYLVINIFCGSHRFENKLPCHATELVKFRKRIGTAGVEFIFRCSVQIHGEAAEEDTVNIDSTVQEKNITYPTDGKLAIKIINRLNKIAKHRGVQQRRTFVKEVKEKRLKLRFFRHAKKRASAKKIKFTAYMSRWCIVLPKAKTISRMNTEQKPPL